jgi:hypothetical protein
MLRMLGVAAWLASAWRIALSLALLTAANYLVWLGWDQRHQAWQVMGLVVGLVALAVFAGLRQRPAVAIVVIPAVMTLCFSVDAARDSPFWAIGAVMVALGTLIGTTVVASLASAAGSWRRSEFR